MWEEDSSILGYVGKKRIEGRRGRNYTVDTSLGTHTPWILERGRMMKKGVWKKARRAGIIAIAAVMAWAICACGGKNGEAVKENGSKGENSMKVNKETAEQAVKDATGQTAKDAAGQTVDAGAKQAAEDAANASAVGTENNGADLNAENFASGISNDTDGEGKDKTREAAAEGKDKAATEGKDSDEKAGSEENSVPELSPEIEERCPVNVANRKAGVSYPKAKHVNYYSTTCGRERGVNILLPADYSEDKQYPVFYLLHGIFGNENSFTSDSGNKINEIVSNMSADGYIPQPIIVFPNMYASSDPAQQPGFTAEACEPYDNFVNDLVNDLMPYMAENYSILTGRENTWLAGFSMGGRETLYITLCHPELFGYVCAISPAPGMTPAADMYMEHPGTLSEDEVRYDDSAVLPNVLMICCGTRDSVVGKFPLAYHELYEKNGIDHIWYEINGADHDNNAIKSGIYNILKAIALDKH